LKASLTASKKLAGKQIGTFKDKIATKPIRKLSIPKLEGLDLKVGASELSPGIPIRDRLANIKNYKELDDVISDIGATLMKIGSNNRDGFKLSQIKSALTDSYAAGLKGKPKQAYKQYAMIKDLYYNIIPAEKKLRTGHQVMKQVLTNGETVKQFKKVAYTLKKPELVDFVKDNYLSNIFNAKNWKLSWEKAAKTNTMKELLDKNTINKINTLLKYDQQMRSTMTSTVNPSRSGIIGLMGDKGVKNAIVDVLFGEGRQLKKTLGQYDKIIKLGAEPKTIDIPLRGARSAIGRTLTESLSNE